ncbi:hypothetical protein [Motilimonas pumila]|uniref:hypothetical protein n=1 Tax=Motilimonas pumila TaxID=2303987 RepID=UPI001314A471|nr:hypothetical protein [Motilimonas pumila]
MGKSFHYEDELDTNYEDELVDGVSYKQQKKRRVKQQETQRDKRRTKRDEGWQ